MLETFQQARQRREREHARRGDVQEGSELGRGSLQTPLDLRLPASPGSIER